MRKLVLFSNPIPEILDRLLDEIFPIEFENKICAYVPSDGANKEAVEKYSPIMKEYAKSRGVTEFYTIDNSQEKSESSEQYENILKSNVLVLSGGNTFTFLRNLKRSGLDNAILEFSHKDNIVIAGFSAGAVILSPTINIATIEGLDVNSVGLTDLSGLNLINYEIFPHYGDVFKNEYENYQRESNLEVKRIADDQFIIDYL